jgi:hypothetical protein
VKNDPASSRFLAEAPTKETFLRVTSDFLFGKELLRKKLNPYSEEQIHEPTGSDDYR